MKWMTTVLGRLGLRTTKAPERTPESPINPEERAAMDHAQEVNERAHQAVERSDTVRADFWMTMRHADEVIKSGRRR